MIIKLIKGIRSVFVNPQTHFSLFYFLFAVTNVCVWFSGFSACTPAIAPIISVIRSVWSRQNYPS